MKIIVEKAVTISTERPLKNDGSILIYSKGLHFQSNLFFLNIFWCDLSHLSVFIIFDIFSAIK